MSTKEYLKNHELLNNDDWNEIFLEIKKKKPNLLNTFNINTWEELKKF
jgi:hypothetical protein